MNYKGSRHVPDWYAWRRGRGGGKPPLYSIIVEPGAELYVKLSGVKKGNYYTTRGFDTSANEASDGSWTGGWDNEYLIAIPKESVVRWKLFLHHEPDDVWIEEKLSEVPDVEAIEVATEILDKDGLKDYGPGGDFVINVLNNEDRPVKENAQIYNSFANLAFAGGQLSTAYPSLNNVAEVLEGRTSMIAENFNRNGLVANKHRHGDIWVETIGKLERVHNYETRKMRGVDYNSRYYGFIGGNAGFNKGSANTATNMLTAAVRAESTIKTPVVNIIPHAGVRYVLTKTESYYSKLDGQKAFKNKPHSTSTVQFPIGVGFRSDIVTRSGWKLRPQVNIPLCLPS